MQGGTPYCSQIAPKLPFVLLNFDHYYRDGWAVHFIQADRRSAIGSRTRYFKFAALDSLRAFLTRCQPKNAHACRVRPFCQGVG